MPPAPCHQAHDDPQVLKQKLRRTSSWWFHSNGFAKLLVKKMGTAVSGGDVVQRCEQDVASTGAGPDVAPLSVARDAGCYGGRKYVCATWAPFFVASIVTKTLMDDSVSVDVPSSAAFIVAKIFFLKKTSIVAKTLMDDPVAVDVPTIKKT